MYIIPPQYDDTAPTSASQLSHGNKTTSTKVAIAVALAKQRQDKIEATNYMLRKRRALAQLSKSEELFEEYRETECKRRQSKTLNDEDASFLSTLKYSTCVHEMTKQRIRSLQKSIE